MAKAKTLLIFCDGGARSNPGPAAIGFVVKNERGRVIKKFAKYIGKATNNQAEYKAVLSVWQWVTKHSNMQTFKHKNIEIHFFLDSKLVVNQLNGKYKIKNKILQNFIIKIKALEAKFNKIECSYFFIPRNKNWQADNLVNKILNKSSCHH